MLKHNEVDTLVKKIQRSTSGSSIFPCRTSLTLCLTLTFAIIQKVEIY